MAQQSQCGFFETSAKERVNIDECFHELVRRIKKFQIQGASDKKQAKKGGKKCVLMWCWSIKLSIFRVPSFFFFFFPIGSCCVLHVLYYLQSYAFILLYVKWNTFWMSVIAFFVVTLLDHRISDIIINILFFSRCVNYVVSEWILYSSLLYVIYLANCHNSLLRFHVHVMLIWMVHCAQTFLLCCSWVRRSWCTF